MSVKRRHSSSSSCQIERLESRTFLSAAPAIGPIDAGTPIEHSAIVRDAATPRPVTRTTLKAKAGHLGQGSFFLVTVRAAAALGAPTGTVTLLSKGATVTTLTLTPATSKNPKFAISQAAYTIAPGGGGMPYYFGSHRFGARYTSAGSLLPSKGFGSFTVKPPPYRKLGNHLKIGLVTAGTGTQTLQAGNTANMKYTGFLFDGGSIFDNSDAHSGFSYTEMGSPEGVIKGFDQGALGMKVGETRVLVIPSVLGYGTTGSGASIPPNARLVFLITLVSIT